MENQSHPIESNAVERLRHEELARGVARGQVRRANLKTLLLVAVVFGFFCWAVVDLMNHNFDDATVKRWASAFALIGAVIGLRARVKTAFKRAPDGTIHLLGEDPVTARRPRLSTYLIMVAIVVVLFGFLLRALMSAG